MSSVPPLDMKLAAWDKFRDAVVIPTGTNQLVVSLGALEAWMNCRLTPDEAVEAAVDEGAMLRAIANTLAPQDNVITITAGIMNSRDWHVEHYAE